MSNSGKRPLHKGAECTQPRREAPTQSIGRSLASDGNDDVYERIWSAIIDHSLPPKTRLVENDLCQIFGVGRTRMRQVLQRLAHEHVVTLMRNRSAEVSRPGVREAREVFQARRLIEADVVGSVLRSVTRKEVKRLEDHLARETDAWRTNNRRLSLKLTGAFHLVLAEASGNSILLELLRDLISRSSLIIAVYQGPGTAPCPPNEHRDITAAIGRRDPAAVTLMVRHLDHLLDDLQLHEREEQRIDLYSVLANCESPVP